MSRTNSAVWYNSLQVAVCEQPVGQPGFLIRVLRNGKAYHELRTNPAMVNGLPKLRGICDSPTTNPDDSTYAGGLARVVGSTASGHAQVVRITATRSILRSMGYEALADERVSL